MEIKELFSVKGKTVLVTGGGQGIGRMISEGFVRNGATVFISSRSKSACEATAKELSAVGPGKCHAIALDLSTLKACDELIARLQSEFGVKSLNVLVNNSGATWAEPLETFSEKGWDRVMDLNVKSLFFLTRAALPLLRAAASALDPSRIINVGSVAGIRPQLVGTWSYDVSKGAVHLLTQKLASELASDNITVNALAPGLVLTKMGKQLLSYTSEENLTAQIPLGRLGKPEDMAGYALYLCSRAGAWVSGTILAVDGGQINDNRVRSKL